MTRPHEDGYEGCSGLLGLYIGTISLKMTKPMKLLRRVAVGLLVQLEREREQEAT